MRKGRSSRRSRISRPLVSVKGEALSTDIGPASGLGSPRVIVGVPPSDPPPRDVVEAPDAPSSAIDSIETKPATTRSSVSTMLRGSLSDRVETLPPPPSEPPVDAPAAVVAEAPTPLVPEVEPSFAAAVPPEPPAVEPAPPSPSSAASLLAATIVDAPSPKVDFASTIVDGSSEAAKVEAKIEATPETKPEPKVEAPVEAQAEPAPAPVAEKPAFAKTLAFGSKINELPQSERVETPKAIAERKEAARERLKTKRDQAQEAQKAVSPKEDPDEISVPPANDINVDDEKFFGDAEVAVRKSHHEFIMMAQQEAEELVPEKARRKLHPHVIRRREKFAGYVKIAVAGAAIVCLAAVGRSAMHSKQAPSAPATQAIAAAPETPPPAPVAPVAEKAAEPAAAPAAPAVESPPAPAASAEPAKEEITGDAKEELKKSRTALEKRKLPEAIEAGERAVALDPTDAEAWLILGAAYQEKGDLTNAHRCYMACVKEGKTGPRLECQKMLR